MKKSSGYGPDFLDKFTGGDRNSTIQLIEIFLKQVPEAIEKLNVHIPRRDWKETHAVAHKLKSSIAIFELHELKKLITNIEEYARDGERLEDLPHLYAEFKEGSKNCRAKFRSEIVKVTAIGHSR
ncbi:MAG: Hpt domain-containing protein [Saprospiraceae bacterium]|nr:Hpt domain-containing protein [Candidatus Brachybacter algidus]